MQQLEANDTISYNFVMTTEWMYVCPRSKDAYHGSGHTIDVNSTGMVGLLLTKSEEESTFLEKMGPLSVLAEVGKPWPSKVIFLILDLYLTFCYNRLFLPLHLLGAALVPLIFTIKALNLFPFSSVFSRSLSKSATNDYGLQIARLPRNVVQSTTSVQLNIFLVLPCT
jgi:ATP adenylyltransferase C-terminal domain